MNLYYFARVLCVTYIISLTLIFNLYSFHIDNQREGKLAPVCPRFIYSGAEKFFVPLTHAPFDSNLKVITDPLFLCQAAQDTLKYLNLKKDQYSLALTPLHFQNSVPIANVVQTLRYLVTVILEDKRTGHYRILDPNFIIKHFSCIKWTADILSAREKNIKIPEDGQIRLTNYVIFNVNGNYKKTSKYNCALYRLEDKSIRKKYTKQQIISGVFNYKINKTKAFPLAWLTRNDFEDALMQGTVIINFPDKKSKIFIVDCSNGIDFNQKNKNIKNQKRYWFFTELKRSAPSVEQIKKNMSRRKNVIFAGDIYNIGLGKLIAIAHTNPISHNKELRLGILADTGGFFMKNLYQLDLFGGIFSSRAILKNYLKQLPMSTNAYILYKNDL